MTTRRSGRASPICSRQRTTPSRTSLARAAEYLARVTHPGPAYLVLDVQLPGLDGLVLQRQLTEEGRMEQIVFITGHGDIPMGIGAMKRGAVDFLLKPFDDGALLNAVRHAP